MMAKKVAVGRGRRREKRRESTRSDQTAGMAERAAAPFSICLSDPQGRHEAVVQEGAQNGVKKVNPFWGSSILGLNLLLWSLLQTEKLSLDGRWQMRFAFALGLLRA
jgi:hypothetical protein